MTVLNSTAGNNPHHDRPSEDSSGGAPAAASYRRLEALLAATGHGDRDAFGQLYDRVAGRVTQTALAVVRDQALAEDVAQETMLEVWSHAARYRPERGSPWSWILRIAHRRAIDRVRHEQALAERETRWGQREELAVHDPVADYVERSADGDRVLDGLDALTPLQREAITLAYYEGLSYPQVARQLDIPLGTVKTRMRDGMKRLKARLHHASAGSSRPRPGTVRPAAG
ncbi:MULTISPECIES: sigma-70 family RNA polymerase sigma factor [unclassified Streptomyces]|uniref:sigma-70 family RNA polymerase sigma factor n=1 Tax=unclassified Streptomyces TaxID=2593676 RepID=UPI000CD4AA2C|nr:MULTISPECIES: sigma-70 family RNA polymerase sigma factor [unclassified Streptomyces]